VTFHGVKQLVGLLQRPQCWLLIGALSIRGGTALALERKGGGGLGAIEVNGAIKGGKASMIPFLVWRTRHVYTKVYVYVYVVYNIFFARNSWPFNMSQERNVFPDCSH
jgi:hypothetical protein